MDIFEKIKNCEPIEDCEFNSCDENPIDIFRAYESVVKDLKTANEQAVTQYEQVVKQNVNLQNEIKTLKSQPFFPYKLNSGNNTDFGEFILISHAWFTISNLPAQLGIVDVVWKSSGVRKMYLGAGCSGGKDFKSDVLAVAMHGQKIKDLSEV